MKMKIAASLIVMLQSLALLQSQETTPTQEDFCISTWNTYGKVAIDLDYKLPIDTVRVIKIYFCQKIDMIIQLWLPTGRRDELELIWEYPINAPNDVPRELDVVLPDNAHVEVLPTYRMGVAPITPGPFPMGMKFFPGNQGSVVVSDPNYYPDKFLVGRKVEFIELLYPYKFSLNLCNDTVNCKLPDISKTTRPLLTENVTTPEPISPSMGLPGPEGPMGIPGFQGGMGDIGVVGITGDPGPVGEEGASGTPGSTGPYGLEGEKGPTGDRGPPGTNGKRVVDKPQASSTNDECGCTGLREPNVVLGMLIWALLLTVLIIVGLVIVTRTEDHQYHEKTTYSER